VARVAWLGTLDDRDRDRAGAKAFVLSRLRRAGLPVPDGFVLAAGERPDDPSWREEVTAAYHELGGPVAVRSSSLVEDGAQASFAGQFETLLGVAGEDQVVEAARRCLRSAGRAGGYARAVGERTDAPLAVLVQRFVDAPLSGVVFTRDPRDASALVVEAHPGVGGVVGGQVSPERYVLDRSGRVRSAPDAASVDEPTLRAVVALALAAEQLLGGPQDVEWALAPGGPVLLQSRPITATEEAAEALDPRLRRLTRANVGEVLPGALTPLTWTTVGSFLEQGFEAVAREAGVRPPGDAPFLALHRRRLYLNLDLALEVATRLPFVDAREAERLVLGEGASALPGPPRGARRGRRRAFLRVLRMAASLSAAERRAAAAVAALRADGPPDPAAEEIARRLEELVAVGRDVGRTHIAVSGASAVRLAVLARVLGRLAGGDPVERVNRLVAAIDDVESAAPTRALEALAEEAARRPDWSAWLERPPEDNAAALGTAPDGLGERLQAFLARYGHRGVSEAELRARAWADDAAPVLGALQALMRADGAPARRRAARAELREADEAAILSALGPPGRALVSLLLRGAREGVRRRERTKSLAVMLVDRARGLVRAAASRLVREGRLATEDDVFFLTRDELIHALGGTAPAPPILLRRRRAHEREAALPAPRLVDLGAAAEADAPTAPVAEGDDGTLRGLGVSAGVGAGRVRVLAGEEAERLQPGEVLVTPVLDAALGPALASAAAAVAEIGGLLSHGAVVARELGVPCVVDVAGATRALRTGDHVLVDGARGRVLRRAPGASAPAAPALMAAPAADEAFHPLADDPRARESIYVNAVDPARGLVLVASAGVRAGGRAEALAAIGLPDGRVLFRFDRAGARFGPRRLTVGAITVSWDPPGLAVHGDCAPHEGHAFPPGPLPLLLAPRTTRVDLALSFHAATPAVDLAAALPDELALALRELASHHVEQSGDWRGTLALDGRPGPFEGTGSRDHSWGLRDWDAADHWRLFTFRVGDIGVHALAVAARGRLVEGGFLSRGGDLRAVTRVEYAAERAEGRVCGFQLELWTGAESLRVSGEVLRTIRVPVQLERRAWRHLAGKPYRLALDEQFTRYALGGAHGYGMAEFTTRA
jgi:pyruvate,water dikinase